MNCRVMPDAPSELVAILNQAMSKEPGDRFADAGRPFDQQRFLERRRELERRPEIVSGDETALGEAFANPFGDHEWPSATK